GDILVNGTPARIGLEHPADPTKAVGAVSVRDSAIAASAPNRRAWPNRRASDGGLHHVLDATTGLPTSGILATWAIAPTAMQADGLATALFFADPERLRTRVVADGGALEWVT